MRRAQGCDEEFVEQMMLLVIVLFLYAGLPFLIGLAIGRLWSVGAVAVAVALVVISDTDDWVRVAPLYAAWFAVWAASGVGARNAIRHHRLRQSAAERA